MTTDQQQQPEDFAEMERRAKRTIRLQATSDLCRSVLEAIEGGRVRELQCHKNGTVKRVVFVPMAGDPPREDRVE